MRTQKNRLYEIVILRTLNICLDSWNKEIYWFYAKQFASMDL